MADEACNSWFKRHQLLLMEFPRIRLVNLSLAESNVGINISGRVSFESPSARLDTRKLYFS